MGGDFPFNMEDVVSLLQLQVRRRLPDGVYADCPFCGQKRGKLRIHYTRNVWRCNRCGESGGMLALYAKVHGISNSAAYREIADRIVNGLSLVPVRESPAPIPAPQSDLVAIPEIHRTLSALLHMLTLNERHRDHLRTVRGLTDEQIDRLEYRSTPPHPRCRGLASRLLELGFTLQGVPGFYQKDGVWTIRFSSSAAGILIPVRGVDGMIRGCQIRLDRPLKGSTKYLWLSSAGKPQGVSSGSPVHFVGDPFARVVYVTEGALKADVAHHMMHRTFAAIAGINNTSQLDLLFALLAENGTQLIVEAADMDKFTNEAVRKGTEKIYLLARKHGMECRRLTWDPAYKGIDDWQLALRHHT